MNALTVAMLKSEVECAKAREKYAETTCREIRVALERADSELRLATKRTLALLEALAEAEK